MEEEFYNLIKNLEGLEGELKKLENEKPRKVLRAAEAADLIFTIRSRIIDILLIGMLEEISGIKEKEHDNITCNN